MITAAPQSELLKMQAIYVRWFRPTCIASPLQLEGETMNGEVIDVRARGTSLYVGLNGSVAFHYELEAADSDPDFDKVVSILAAHGIFLYGRKPEDTIFSRPAAVKPFKDYDVAGTYFATTGKKFTTSRLPVTENRSAETDLEDFAYTACLNHAPNLPPDAAIGYWAGMERVGVPLAGAKLAADRILEAVQRGKKRYQQQRNPFDAANL